MIRTNRLTVSKYGPLKLLHNLAKSISEKFPTIDEDTCFKGISKATVKYRYDLIDVIYADDRELDKSIFDVCCKARELLNSMNKLDRKGMSFVNCKWGEGLSGKNMWRISCNWLENLSKQCVVLANRIEETPSKPGVKIRTRDAELSLLKAIDDFLPKDIPERERDPLLRKIALVIHAFSTGEKKPQKFRKLQKTV